MSPVFLLLLLGCREPLGPGPAPLAARAPRIWASTLERVVDDAGDVDYEALRADPTPLEDFLRWIERPGALKGRTGDQTHAFWLNAYNALVIYEVLERDVHGSVREVPSALPFEGARFWFGTEFVVAGESMSLWELGHERLTHVNQEYRDFAALPLAARSGPPVPNFLFNGDDLDAQLDHQTNRFFASDRALRVEPDDTLRFNPFFDRYALEFDLYTADFGLCAVAAMHTTGERQAALLSAAENGCPHDFFAFDWTLNQAEAQ